MVGSLGMFHKVFPYKNMCVDHIRPRRTSRYASPFVEVIRWPGREMYLSTSHGSVYVAIDLLLV